MKKIFCFLLSALLIAAAFAGCTPTEETPTPETVKLGLGLDIVVGTPTNATEDKDGQAKATITVAAVTVGADGKILDCVIDCADNTVKYTADGKAVAVESFKTKYELGDAYNMVAYGGAKKEWYAQVDAFEALVRGKTLTEVQALVVNNDKGNDDVQNAGCTITVVDFVKAIEKAYNGAQASQALATDTLKLGVQTMQSVKDAEEDKDGQNQVETTFFAATVAADGKVSAAKTDCVQVKFTFDAAGASTYDATKTVSSKGTLGTNYGMSQYGQDLNGDGTVKEWTEQAAIFEEACIGKTATEIVALMADNNYGVSDLQVAGCTILVNGFVKAAAKIG